MENIKPIAIIYLPKSANLEQIHDTYKQLESLTISKDYHILVSYNNCDLVDVKIISIKDIEEWEIEKLKTDVITILKN